MSRTRIVAVDDERQILRVLKRSCEAVGCEVHAVVDAGFFESCFRAFEPSLIFLDLNMSNIDGVELLRFIARERSDTSVVLTSGVDERLLGAAHALGLSLGLRMLEPLGKPLIAADVRQRLEMYRAPPTAASHASIEANELHRALTDGMLDVHYQPMIDLDSAEVVAIEALARIRGRGTNILCPEQFIPVAECSGLIEMLSFGVMERALADLASLNSQSPQLRVAVNLSPLVLCDLTLPDRISTLLRRHNVGAEQLVIEVTETSAPQDPQLMAVTLRRLRKLGITLALDDFGTGLCSLGQLYEFPYETLKLDKKFAMQAHSSVDAAQMIRSSLELARSVGLTVVAEGIQCEETMHWLNRLGCNLGQGFYISPPLPLHALMDWLEYPGLIRATGQPAPAQVM